MSVRVRSTFGETSRTAGFEPSSVRVRVNRFKVRVIYI